MGTKTLKSKINKDFTELEKAFSPIDRLYEHVHLYQTQMSTVSSYEMYYHSLECII